MKQQTCSNNKENISETYQVNQEGLTLHQKRTISKVVMVSTSLPCLIVTIYILSRSSSYFSYMFSLSNQILAKQYLKQHYRPYMVTLYSSIIGFLLLIGNIAVFFFKFSQKGKIIWIYGTFYLAFLIMGIVTLTDQEYHQHMQSLVGISAASPLCSSSSYHFECSLSSEYVSYRSSFIIFFVMFCIFFFLHALVYHCSLITVFKDEIQIVKTEKESSRNQVKLNNEETQLVEQKQQKKMETFISDADIDQYMS